MALRKIVCMLYLYIHQPTESMLIMQQGRQHPLQQHGWIPSKGLRPNERGTREVHHPQPYTAAGADSTRCNSVGPKAYAQTSVAQRVAAQQKSDQSAFHQLTLVVDDAG